MYTGQCSDNNDADNQGEPGKRLTDSCEQSPDSPPPSIKRNFSWTLAGNLIYAGCQWGMLVVLAKLGTPEMVGRFALGLAVTAPVVMFSNLQLRAVQATDAKRDYIFGDYFGARIVTSALAMLVILGIAIFSHRSLEASLVIIATGSAKIFESVSDIFYGLFQQRERMDRVATSMMIKGPVSLAGLWFGVWITNSVLWGTVALALAWALVLLVYDIPNGSRIIKTPDRDAEIVVKQTIKPRWNPRTLWSLIWLSLPLGFVMMLISLNANIPRYFVEKHLGEASLGVFASLAYLYTIGSMFVSSLENSVSPRLARHYVRRNRKAFQLLLAKLVLIGCLFGAGLVIASLAAGKEIITLLYRPEYAKDIAAFAWLMAAAGIGAVAAFVRCGMTAARYFAIQMPLWVVVTSVTTYASYRLVPAIGLRGAALALVLGASVQLIGNLIVIIHAISRLKTRA